MSENGGSFLRRGGISQGERSAFQSMPEMQARANDGQFRAAHSFQRESASPANVFTRTRGRLSVAEVVMLMLFPSSLKISVLKDSAIFPMFFVNLVDDFYGPSSPLNYVFTAKASSASFEILNSGVINF